MCQLVPIASVRRCQYKKEMQEMARDITLFNISGDRWLTKAILYYIDEVAIHLQYIVYCILDLLLYVRPSMT